MLTERQVVSYQILIEIYTRTLAQAQVLAVTHQAMMCVAEDGGANLQRLLAWCRQPVMIPAAVPRPVGPVTDPAVIAWTVSDHERKLRTLDASLRAEEEAFLLDQLR